MADDTEDEIPAGKQTDDDLLDEARKRYRMCQDAEDVNRPQALDDLNFLIGGENQWDALAVAARKRAGRPVITVNVLPTYLHQVTNDQNRNTPSIKVHPVGSSANIETAKVRQGLIRHIEYDSNADTAYDTAVNSAAAVGFGYFRIVTEYESEASFNQKLRIERITNPLSVKIDPLNTEADGSGMQYAFLEYPMSRETFKREYPDAKANDMSVFAEGQGYTGWLSDNLVLVCDYYRIEKTKEKVVLLSNGESGFKSDLVSMPEGVSIVKERDGERSKVMLYKITGCDVLERTEIKCKWIPVFPVYGDELNIEGKIIRSGMIRHAKGPCQSYNVFMSAATEEISLRTKAPYIGAHGQFEGHEEEWQQANNTAYPYLEYEPVSADGHLAPPPQRQPMADIPAGMLAMAMHARDNVKATTGLFDSSLGAKGTATSGVQEREQQQQGDVANSHYMEGLIRTIRHVGRCINCMIPKYYDAERVISIMQEDGKMDHATINQPAVQQVQQPDGTMVAVQTVLNDLTCGEFDVTVSAGPTYSTLRQEAADGMAQNMAKNPQLWGVIGDLYVKNQDWPGADEMADRLKKTIPPNIRGPEKGEAPPEPMVQTPNGPVPIQQAAQMIGQMQEQLQKADEAVKQADGAKHQAEALKQQHLVGEQQLEPVKLKVEGQRLEAELAKAEAVKAQADAAKLQAQADLVRAQAEAGVAPATAEANLHKARATALVAENTLRQPVVMPKAPAEEEAAEMAMLAKIEKIVSAKPVPKSMTIKAPSGMSYEVAVH